MLSLSLLAVLLIFYSIYNLVKIFRQYLVIEDNILEIKKARSELYYVFDCMLGMIYMTDMSYRVNWANDSLLELDKDVIGKPIIDLFHYNNNETQLNLISKVLVSNSVERNVVYYPSNTLFRTETYIEHRAIPIIDEDEISFIVVISDNITGQMQLSEARQRLSLMVSASKDTIFVIDLNKHITSWNKGAEEIFGYLSSEIIGQPITILDHLVSFDILTTIFDIDKIIETKTITNIENVEINGLNFYRIVDFTVYPFFDDIGSVIGISAIVRDRTETVKAKKALELSEIQMRKLALHLDAIREEERKEIAFIIHDDLGYALSSIKMDISWLRRNIDKMTKDNIDERTDDMLKLVNVTIQNVKTLSSNLRPSILDHFGLIAAIEEQSREFQRRTGIRCKVNVLPDEDIYVPDNVRTPLFRIFQEAQTNITRYAKASRVDVNISYDNELFVLEIVDNGVGIPKDKIDSINSFGLLGIREKAKSIGGNIFISGEKDKGTTIRVELKMKL
jgi:PAS domain S-box-containing protein